MLLRVRAVEARQRLHRLDARERLVHVHRVQQRLVVAGLELVGADQEAVRVGLDLVGDVAAWKAVERRLADLRAAVLVLAGEGDDRLIRALALREIRLEGVEVLDGPLDAARHHHRPRLSADLARRQHLLVEVVHHDLGLEPDRVVVALDIPAQLLLRLLGVELRVVLDLLDQLVVAVHRRVGLEHVEDEALLDRLLHRVAVEGPVLDLALGVGRQRLAEHLQRLVLGRGGEGEVAGVGQHLARRHALLERLVHRVLGVGSSSSSSAGAPSAWLIAAEVLPPWLECASSMTMAKVLPRLGRDLVEDEGELLHRRDDDLLPLLDELAQVAGVLGVAHRRAHLHELLDGRLDLVVEEAPVGDHDDRVEDLLVVALQADELVREPGDGVRLAAARRVLDQVALARAVGAHIGQRLPHHAELVVARPHLLALLLAGASGPSPRRSARSSRGCWSAPPG